MMGWRPRAVASGIIAEFLLFVWIFFLRGSRALGVMAVASRLAVARVVAPDGGGRRGRQGFAVVGFPAAAAARRGRRRGGAVAASPPTEEVAQLTEPLTKEDLVAYLASGCKPKENWR